MDSRFYAALHLLRILTRLSGMSFCNYQARPQAPGELPFQHRKNRCLRVGVKNGCLLSDGSSALAIVGGGHGRRFFMAVELGTLWEKGSKPPSTRWYSVQYSGNGHKIKSVGGRMLSARVAGWNGRWFVGPVVGTSAAARGPIEAPALAD